MVNQKQTDLATNSRVTCSGIWYNAELAQTLADIDRLSDETEALLGNTRREPPTPPGALRDNDPLSSGTTGSDLSGEEADVIIVSHDKPTPRQTLAAVATRHAQRPSFRKIVKYPNPARQIGGSQAAVHRNALDEASVEIVEHGGTRPGQSAGNTAAVAKQQHAGSIRRFLKALSGE